MSSAHWIGCISACYRPFGQVAVASEEHGRWAAGGEPGGG